MTYEEAIEHNDNLCKFTPEQIAAESKKRFEEDYTPGERARMAELQAILEPIRGGYTNEQMALYREYDRLWQKPWGHPSEATTGPTLLFGQQPVDLGSVNIHAYVGTVVEAKR